MPRPLDLLTEAHALVARVSGQLALALVRGGKGLTRRAVGDMVAALRAAIAKLEGLLS